MSDDNKLTVMLMEYESVTNEMNDINLSFVEIQNLPFILFTGIFAISIGNEIKSIFNFEYMLILLPFLIYKWYYHVIKYTIKIFKLSGYKKFLEEKINKLVKEKILLFNSEKLDTYHHHVYVGGVGVGIFGTVMLGITLYIAYGSARHLLTANMFLIYVVVNFIILFYLGSLIRILMRTEEKTYKRAIELSLFSSKGIVIENSVDETTN